MNASLTDRQERVLRYLATRPAMNMRGYTAEQGVYAFQVEQECGLQPERRGHGPRNYQPTGTANTLKALKRRGLAEFGLGPGVFVQATWRITKAGDDFLASLTGTTARGEGLKA